MTAERDLMAEIDRLLAGDVALPEPATTGEALAVPEAAERLDSPRAARDHAVRLRAGLRAALDELIESDEDGDEWPLLVALEDATAAYLAALPRVDVARCPFTGATATIAIDTYGLDGPWWNYFAALRPMETRPATLVAFTGALRLAATVERTRNLVKPGPGVPYLLPRLLAVEGVRAVIRAVAVGDHLGWVVSYFAEHFPADAPRANDWGTDHYPAGDGWDAVPDHGEVRDFDLAPWIERGRLAWIAPGNATLTPRTTVQGCPFLGLPGERGIQHVEGDDVWADTAP